MADEGHTLDAQVLTPEGEVFSGDLSQLSTRTAVGEVGILARHAPMVARLVPAELRLHTPDGEVQRYAQGEGWLEVFANRARVLIAEAIPPDQLEAGELRERLEEAEQRLSDAEEGSAAHELAEREKARVQAFLEIAENAARRSLSRVQARALTEELIAYDTSTEEGIKLCAGFVKGWLDARDIAAEQMGVRGLPVTVAEVGPADGKPVLLLHGHLDVVPGPAGAVHASHRGRPPLRPRAPTT